MQDWTVVPGPLDLPLGPTSLLTVYTTQPSRTVIGIGESEHSAVYTVSIEMSEARLIPRPVLEEQMVSLFNVVRRRSQCVMACGSELYLDEDYADLSAAADAAMSRFLNASWVFVDAETFHEFSSIPDDTNAECAGDDLFLLRRPLTIADHILIASDHS